MRAYAKPLLSALVLYVLTAKLVALVNIAAPKFAPSERDKLVAGLVAARNAVADSCTPDEGNFRALLAKISRALSLFRAGMLPSAGSSLYHPLTTMAVHRLPTEPAIPGSGLGELAIGAALLGMGLSLGAWTVIAEDDVDPRRGAVQVTGSLRSARIFFAANSHAVHQLKASKIVAEDDGAIIVHSLEILLPMPRSPRAMRGRKGRLGLCEVSISTLVATACDADGLLQRFREKVTL